MQQLQSVVTNDPHRNPDAAKCHVSCHIGPVHEEAGLESVTCFWMGPHVPQPLDIVLHRNMAPRTWKTPRMVSDGHIL